MYAQHFVEKIFEAVDRMLPAFPLLSRRVPEAENDNIREILFRSYRIIYRVENDRILMLGVLHGAQDLAAVEVKPWDRD